MKKIATNILWSILILFAIAIVFSGLFGTNDAAKKVSLNELATKINTGEVQKIIVRGDDLAVTLKDGAKLEAQKETETSLSETLKNYDVDPLMLRAVALEIEGPSGIRFWMGILIPTILPILLIAGLFYYMLRQAKGGVSQAFTFGRSNIRLVTPLKDHITFRDVAGLKEAKHELEEVVDFLKNPKKYLEIGAQIPRGVLLIGPPGTGKTLLARAVAGEARAPFFHISASEFVEMFVGVGAARTRDAFAIAKRAAPAILFIDEIDAVGRERGAGLGGGHDEREQTLNQILVEMDGFERDTRVIILAATNRPDILDSALLRPGRFDRRVMLDLPDIKDREDILKIHARGKLLDKTVDLRKVAVRTPGFSGADLANLMNEAAIMAAGRNKRVVTQDELFASIEKVLLGPERRGRAVSEREKKITAYHEAGHALVGASIAGSDPVHKVSIISRGRAGGYTLKLPTEEERLRTKSQYLADLAVLLGGYASEELVFKDISSGGSNDLKEASELARRLVTKFGMSEKIGPVIYGGGEELVFLGRELATEKNYSENIATHIDEEISHFIHKAYAAAKKIITSRRNVLDAIAHALMEKESLEQEEFYGLLKPFKLKPIALS